MIDEKVEKNIIDFFNEEIIDVKEISEKKNCGTDLFDNIKKTKIVMSNNIKLDEESKDTKSKLINDKTNKRVLNSYRKKSQINKNREDDFNSYEKNIIKTEPTWSNNLKDSQCEKSREKDSLKANNIIKFGLDSINESN